jgi:hypothetical protein
VIDFQFFVSRQARNSLKNSPKKVAWQEQYSSLADP